MHETNGVRLRNIGGSSRYHIRASPAHQPESEAGQPSESQEVHDYARRGLELRGHLFVAQGRGEPAG